MAQPGTASKKKGSGKKPRRPEQPRLRNVFGRPNAAWLILEPHRVGLLIGTLAATLLLSIQFIRQLQGALVDVGSLLVGALTLFVVSYGASGLFVWYLLYVRERELAPVEEKKVSHELKGRKHAEHHDAPPHEPALDSEPLSEEEHHE